MKLINELRGKYRPEMIEELGAYTQMLEELSDDESDEEVQEATNLFIPYVPNRSPAHQNQNTLGSHRSNIQRWNHSVSSLLPQSPGHRRLHSDGKIVLRKSKFSKRFDSQDCAPTSSEIVDIPKTSSSDCE